MFLPKQQADAIVVTQLVTLGVKMHTRRLMRGDVLRKVALLKKLAPTLTGDDLAVMNSIFAQFAP